MKVFSLIILVYVVVGSPSTLYRSLSPACWTNIVFFSLFFLFNGKKISLSHKVQAEHTFDVPNGSRARILHTPGLRRTTALYARPCAVCTNHEHGVHTTRFTDKNPFSRSPLFTLYSFFFFFFLLCECVVRLSFQYLCR